MTMLLDQVDGVRNIELKHYNHRGIVHAVEMMWTYPREEGYFEQITTRCQITAKGKRKLTSGAITCLACLAMEPSSSSE